MKRTKNKIMINSYTCPLIVLFSLFREKKCIDYYLNYEIIHESQVHDIQALFLDARRKR